uniref:Uncharacterized protein n=1 Tax=Utricularia reniformis TaxID=192314 RepID=A0A1Y0B4M4_9LAMI|nr:hypothetical protein AEK19_MT2216 [Utricularia reniformis]ART32362.1 hypothetical protein AEK19_MT2216 [Utricularia reniformis]
MITIVEDFSRATWVYLIHSKIETSSLRKHSYFSSQPGSRSGL